MAILDSSYLIDLLHGLPRAVAFQDRLEETGEPQVAPAPAIYEITIELGGKKTSPARARRLSQAVDALAIAPLTREIAADAGRLRGTLLDAGTPVDDFDCMIAATAVALEDRLVTANRKDFLRIPRLRVASY